MFTTPHLRLRRREAPPPSAVPPPPEGAMLTLRAGPLEAAPDLWRGASVLGSGTGGAWAGAAALARPPVMRLETEERRVAGGGAAPVAGGGFPLALRLADGGALETGVGPRAVRFFVLPPPRMGFAVGADGSELSSSSWSCVAR